MAENSPEKKIKSKNSEEFGTLTYKKRKGTTDVGKLYEDYLPAYVILQLLQNNDVKDFQISTNDENFGAFDDFVLDVEQINKPTEKYAIQLKHISNRELKLNNLRAGNNFNIMKYYVSFQENYERLSEYKLILCTNSKFALSDATIDLIESDESVIKVKITECVPLQFLKMEFGKSFRFQLGAGNSEEIKEKYKDFFDRFFLYTDQMNVQELEETYIPQSLKTLTSKLSVQDKFLKFISTWSQIDGTKDKLTKDMMIKVMTLHIVEEFIQPHAFCDVNEKQKLFRNAMSHFNITAFGGRSLENVVKIWGDSKHNIKEINEIARRFQIGTKHIETIDDLSDEDSTKLLWIMNKCPLIIKGGPAAYEVAKLCGEKSKFIFITDEVNEIEELTIFKTLSDLKPHDSTYNNILKNLSFILFGEETNLENLIKDDDAFDNLITTDEIAKMAFNLDLIDLKKEELCFSYVERHLYKNIIDSKYLEKVDENTMLVISNVKDEKTLRDGLQNFEVVSIVEELDQKKKIPVGNNALSKKLQNDANKCRLFFNKTDTTQAEFISLCDKSQKYEKFHHFKYHDEHLEWLESIGDVSDLQKLCIRNDNFVESVQVCTENIRNNVNIVVGDPGMGKSVFVKKLKNDLLRKHFAIIIQPIDVPELCRLMKDLENLQTFFTYVVESQFRDFGNLERYVIELLMRKGKAVFLWDALDELSEENRIIIEKLIGTLSKNSVAQFLTSRGFLKKQLEDKFGVLSRELQPFNDQQQTTFLQKRLQEFCSDEELEVVIASIKENIAKTSNREILGVPLQIYMLTELFRHDLTKYKKLLTALFVITELYFHFIEEKFNFHFKVKRKFPSDYGEDLFMQQSLSWRKRNYQQVALQSLFGVTFCTEVNTETERFLSEIGESGDEFGIITAVDTEKQAVFLHNSYGEYFAATYFAENCRNIPNLEDVIFDRKYANVRYFFDTLLAKDSPVHIAVLCKNLRYIQYCEDRDELKRRDSVGRSALHLAASWGERYPLLDTTRLDDSTTILIHDDINFETKKENFEYFQIIEILLKNCDSEEEDGLFKLTPTIYAKKSECLLAVALILKENQSSVKGEGKKFVYSLLYYGIKYAFQDFLNLFPNIEFACTESGSTLLHMAVENNDFQNLAKLLELEVFKKNINYGNRFGETPLLIAVRYNYVEIVKYLIQEDANVNAVDNDGWTPFHLAASIGHLEAMKYLMRKDAGVNSVDNEGWTPLHTSAWNGHFETVKYLIQGHANVNAANNEGWTPLHASAWNGHLETAKYLIQGHSSVNAIDNNGWTPIYLAAWNGHFETVKYLVQGQADVNVVSRDGWTPLHLAAENGHGEIVTYLIQEHANVNAVDKSGWTPLYLAVENGHKKVVEILLEAGADCETPRIGGQTYTDIAVENHHEDIAELLRTHKSKFTKSN